MNDYTEVRIGMTPCTEIATDIAAALLADVGFETFLPDESGLTAYIPARLYKEDLRRVLDNFPISGINLGWEAANIEGQDWNHEWEKNYFKPIVIENECVIHSSFHKNIPECRYDIVIDPKMAFGTGHHSTTSLILRKLLFMDLSKKAVIDMGTGTGILAILAAMKGASPVTGIEIDEPAWENAVANCRLNNHEEISMIHSDAEALASIPYKADLFLANINRNVITADINRYAGAMKPGATLLLSGFYESDIPVILEAANPNGFRFAGHTAMNDWACVELIKN